MLLSHTQTLDKAEKACQGKHSSLFFRIFAFYTVSDEEKKKFNNANTRCVASLLTMHWQSPGKLDPIPYLFFKKNVLVLLHTLFYNVNFDLKIISHC